MNDLKQDILDALEDATNVETGVVWTEYFEDLVDIIVTEQCNMPCVRKRNWFEKLPLYWRYIYYMVGGVAIGYLLNYVL